MYLPEASHYPALVRERLRLGQECENLGQKEKTCTAHSRGGFLKTKENSGRDQWFQDPGQSLENRLLVPRHTESTYALSLTAPLVLHLIKGQLSGCKPTHHHLSRSSCCACCLCCPASSAEYMGEIYQLLGGIPGACRHPMASGLDASSSVVGLSSKAFSV